MLLSFDTPMTQVLIALFSRIRGHYFFFFFLETVYQFGTGFVYPDIIVDGCRTSQQILSFFLLGFRIKTDLA